MKIHTLSLGFVNAYLVEIPGGLVLVDCGTAGQEQKILARVRQLGGELKLIIITHAHADHYGSAAALRRLTGAPVAISRLDAPAMQNGKTSPAVRNRLVRALMLLGQRLNPVAPLQPDRLLDDGDRLDEYGLPGQVILLPGHTPGSLCLRLDDGAGFIGDLVSTIGKPGLQRMIVADFSALRASFQRLRQYQLETAYVGHGRRPLSGAELSALIDKELDLIHN